MELRQLRYFVRVAELGSMGRAAADLGVVASALSQQISRLESELATRLMVRSAAGLAPPTGAVLGLPLMLAMRERYPGVRLHLVESLSGHLIDSRVRPSHGWRHAPMPTPWWCASWPTPRRAATSCWSACRTVSSRPRRWLRAWRWPTWRAISCARAAGPGAHLHDA